VAASRAPFVSVTDRDGRYALAVPADEAAVVNAFAPGTKVGAALAIPAAARLALPEPSRVALRGTLAARVQDPVVTDAELLLGHADGPVERVPRVEAVGWRRDDVVQCLGPEACERLGRGAVDHQLVGHGHLPPPVGLGGASLAWGSVGAQGEVRTTSCWVALVIATCLVFFTYGQIFSLFPATCADTYGKKFASANAGLLYTAKGTASLIVPVSSVIALNFGGWSTVFVISAVMNIVAAALALFALKPMRARLHSATR
jgi:hypothetical protein